MNESELFDYHAALGQFLALLVLQRTQTERTLYFAVPLETYRSFFSRELAQASVQEYQVKMIIYNPISEVISKWIN